MNNAEKSKEDVAKTKAQLQAKVTSLQQELVSVKKAAECAQGQWAEHYPSSPSYQVKSAEQRKASRHNMNVWTSIENCEDDLVHCLAFLIDYILSKASASVLAVDKRQSLESITQKEKAASCTWSQLFEKESEVEERKAALTEGLGSQNTKRQEVSLPLR